MNTTKHNADTCPVCLRPSLRPNDDCGRDTCADVMVRVEAALKCKAEALPSLHLQLREWVRQVEETMLRLDLKRIA